MGTERGARTRKWRKEFDSAPYFEAIGAKRIDIGMGTLGELPNGRALTISTNTVGKVTIMLSSHDRAPLVMRTFGAKQLDEIREWVASGGVLKKEQDRKAVQSAASELLAAVLLLHPDSGCTCKSLAEQKVVHAAIAKARGEK